MSINSWLLLAGDFDGVSEWQLYVSRLLKFRKGGAWAANPAGGGGGGGGANAADMMKFS